MKVLSSLAVFLGATLLPATGAHAAGLIAKGPWVQRVTPTSAVVRVEVDPPAPVTLDLGLGRRTVTSAEARSLHSIELDGLEPGTRYPYSVRAGATSKFAAFVTAPPDDGDAPFRFLVYGDSRADTAAHAAVVRAMVPAASDFLVHTGDLVENGGSVEQWQTFFDLEAPLLGARCFFSCVGDHELIGNKGIEYARFFGPEEPPLGTDGGRAEKRAATRSLRSISTRATAGATPASSSSTEWRATTAPSSARGWRRRSPTPTTRRA